MPLAPRSIQIDASSHCQLACPVCPTADGRTRPVLGAGHLKVGDFEALLDRNPEIRHVEFSNYGEMFLNPALPELLAAAHGRRVVVSGSNGVNLNFAREEALEAVVRYRVRSLTCSIDGATPETYAQYRRKGDLERVLHHIDRILHYKRQYRTGFPLLYWQFVVFGHNEHELEAARAMAAARGMEFVPRLSWDAGYSPVRNSELVTIQTGLAGATREAFKASQGVDYTRDICFQLWRAPVVNWDGKLLGCCVNYWGDFGANVFAEGLAKSAAGERMNRARKMLTGELPPASEVPCSQCAQYESLRDSGRWLTEGEVAAQPEQPYLLSVVPVGAEGMRVARIAVYSTTGAVGATEAATAQPRVGRVFRFGIDHAGFCRVPGPGTYRVSVEVLTPHGWRRTSQAVVFPEQPICQEVILDLRTNQSESTNEPNGLQLPVWIR